MNNHCKLILFYFLIQITKGFAQDLLELNCNVNSDCSHFKGPEYNTTCLDGQCLCSNLNGERTACKPQDNKMNNFIGGTCPCTKPHSICNHAQSICYCEADFVPSFDRRRCIKKNLVLGEKCEDNSQCLGLDRFAECHMEEKKCMCQKNFIDHSGICVSIVGLKNRCLDSQQCLNHTANSICHRNTCTCIKGYTATEDLKCLPFADYRESCEEHNQCKYKLGAGSECYMKKCACDYKHFVFEFEEANGQKHKICERKIVYGDYCIDHNDCYQYHLHAEHQSMECFFGECGCRVGFFNVDGDCVRSGSPWAGANFSIMTGLSLILPLPLSLSSSLSSSSSRLLSLQLPPHTPVTVNLNYPLSLSSVHSATYQSLIPIPGKQNPLESLSIAASIKTKTIKSVNGKRSAGDRTSRQIRKAYICRI